MVPHDLCFPGWSWPTGAEFWASADAIRARTRRYWQLAMHYAQKPQAVARRFDNNRSNVTATAYCLETLWHYMLGEPLHT